MGITSSVLTHNGPAGVHRNARLIRVPQQTFRQRLAAGEAVHGRPDRALHHQLGDTVYKRPELETKQRPGLAVRRRCRDSGFEYAVSHIARFAELGLAGKFFPIAAEHELKESWILDGEDHVTDAARVEPAG